MRMKERALLALDDCLETRRVGQPEDTDARILARRADNSDRLSEGELVARMRMQVER